MATQLFPACMLPAAALVGEERGADAPGKGATDDARGWPRRPVLVKQRVLALGWGGWAAFLAFANTPGAGPREAEPCPRGGRGADPVSK